MRRAYRIPGLVVGALSFALTGFQPGDAAASPKNGGTVIMATGAQVQGFDPLTTRAANRETIMAGALIFSNFFRSTKKASASLISPRRLTAHPMVWSGD